MPKVSVLQKRRGKITKSTARMATAVDSIRPARYSARNRGRPEFRAASLALALTLALAKEEAEAEDAAAAAGCTAMRWECTAESPADSPEARGFALTENRQVGEIASMLFQRMLTRPEGAQTGTQQRRLERPRTARSARAA